LKFYFLFIAFFLKKKLEICPKSRSFRIENWKDGNHNYASHRFKSQFASIIERNNIYRIIETENVSAIIVYQSARFICSTCIMRIMPNSVVQIFILIIYILCDKFFECVDWLQKRGSRVSQNSLSCNQSTRSKNLYEKWHIKIGRYSWVTSIIIFLRFLIGMRDIEKEITRSSIFIFTRRGAATRAVKLTARDLRILPSFEFVHYRLRVPSVS